ncbi:hypothetical protein ASD97_25085 [Streptomyces sp. Root63]|uniref:hypothetical protein n=1 Tax=unclassified Streptomyces TaxID=2593676 RepID=UPI0006FFC0C8|nr:MULTISPECIES: hypothetical protein [unclassified Streptomyces]KQX27573.1 hypothetical protein ASD29_30315 [Streptomyces sp. Root1295]KRA34813.1 hypothetical protein ASD97_25085 [Streptomyces sp. Root63]
MRIFGREPVYVLGFIAAGFQALTAFGLDVTETQQTLVNFFAAAVVGVITAIVLKTGALAAALLGFAQSGMALAVGFGLDWSTDMQGKVMAAVAALLALWLREKVTAPVPLTGLELSSPVKAPATVGG